MKMECCYLVPERPVSCAECGSPRPPVLEAEDDARALYRCTAAGCGMAHVLSKTPRADRGTWRDRPPMLPAGR